MSTASSSGGSASLTVAVLGAGAWGSTLAQLFAANGHTVRAWSRRGDITLETALAGADVIVSAVSMKGVRAIATQVRAVYDQSQGRLFGPTTVFLTATKGLDPDSGSATALPLLPSQLWQQSFPEHAIAVLSGPNLSKEIQQGLPAATVIGCAQMPAAETIQTALSSRQFRVYTNPDILGVELGGTLKNVIAIAAGVCDGLKLGTNAKAALLTRALPEMIRVGTQLGAQPETFFGLAGLGDLLATCSSSLSRNYRVGYGLAQGQSLEEVLEGLQSTAEGVNTTNVLMDLARREKIPVPIARQVYRLLHGKATPQEAVQTLMARDLKQEFEDELL